jgi:hypothetical protein
VAPGMLARAVRVAAWSQRSSCRARARVVARYPAAVQGIRQVTQPQIRYFVTSSIWIDLADHCAAGLRRCDIGLRIMELPDPGLRYGTLLSKPAADDRSLIVTTASLNPEVHAIILSDIAELLDVMMTEREVETVPMVRTAPVKRGWLESLLRKVLP